jgi:hypothetical protein
MSSFVEERNRVLLKARNLSEDALNGVEVWASCIKRNGESVTMNLNSLDLAPRVLRYLVEHGADVFEFTPQRLSLEERFLEILGADEGQ